ncbi:type VI-B CRISPR-associated RNA-guided ribonuclease Cas13b [Prevotella koreensis]
MENNNNTKESTYTLDNKHFWAAFLNLARHNVYITVNHINKTLGEGEINRDGYESTIENTWNEIKDINKKARLSKLIIKHFPFLEAATYRQNPTDTTKQKEEKQAEAQSLESLKKSFFVFIYKLQDLRNHYSHYKHSKSLERPKFEEDLLKNMYNIFNASIRLVKEDYQYNKNINPKKDFKHLDRKRKGKFHYSFADNEGNITESGLLFFVSLFLEKKDAIWIQKKLEGFKCSNESYQKMTNEVFCRSRMLLPKLRLESTQTQDWILLDMLNELIRCPKSLYERLRGDDRKKFRVPFDPIDEDYDAEQEPFKNTLVRHQDRFPYFALRYFDYNEIFTNLRFQIDLGTYHFSIYKKLIGGQKEDRHLTHKLYGFERIQEFAKHNRTDEWKDIVKDLDTYETSNERYISETIPHYHLENQKIGIRFRNGNNDIWPSLETNGENNEKSKYKLDKQYQAEAFLSVHELLPMMFYYLLLKTENTDNDNEIETKKKENKNDKQEKHKIEEIIENKITEIYALYDTFANGEINSEDDLKEYLKGKDIEIVHLPKQMIAILKNKHKDMAEKAEAKQEKMKLATENRLKTLDKQLKGKIQYGKRGKSPLKSGEIASWLLNDMMRFQPVQRDEKGEPLNNSKANSTEYQLLQRTLALFGSEHKRLTPYFKQTKLIESSNPHPFLNDTEWEKCNNILSFYRNYLKAKKNFLESLKPEDWEKNQYFLMLKEPKTNRKTLVQGWKNGFNLPRGIFTEPIRKWFMEHWKNIKVEDLKRVGLVAKVIPLFFSEKYKDSVQPFYNYPFNVGDVNKPKEEDFLDYEKRRKLWGEKKDKFKGYKEKVKSKKLTDKEKEEYRSYLEFQSWNKFERELRLVRNQDIVTWLLCTELIDKLKVDELNIEELQKLRLKDIDTDTAKKEKNNILNRVMPMELPVTVYEINKGGYIIKNKPLHTIYIKEAETKLLKQGNFKALVKDRRLNGLFSFVKTSSEAESKSNPISKLRVEYELGKYQNARLDIIKDMLALEKMLIDKYNGLDTDNFYNMLTGWLKLKGEANKARFQNDVNLLVAVRNAFSHNQFPMYDKNLFGNIERFSLSSSNNPEEKGLGIAVKLKDKVSKSIEKIKNEEDDKKNRN